MKNKPDIENVKLILPEAKQLEEIGSGGFKIVYRAMVNNMTEAVKLIEIPSDDNGDNTIRDENIGRIEIVRQVETV